VRRSGVETEIEMNETRTATAEEVAAVLVLLLENSFEAVLRITSPPRHRYPAIAVVRRAKPLVRRKERYSHAR